MVQAVSVRKRRKSRRVLPLLCLCHACRKGRAWKMLMGKKARMKLQKKRKKSGKRPTNHTAMRKWWVHFLERPAALHAKVADILNIVFSVKFPCNVVYNYMYILNLNITCGHLPVCPGYCKEEAAKTPQPAGSTSRSTIEQVEKTGWGGVCTVSMYVSVGAHETAK